MLCISSQWEWKRLFSHSLRGLVLTDLSRSCDQTPLLWMLGHPVSSVRLPALVVATDAEFRVSEEFLGTGKVSRRFRIRVWFPERSVGSQVKAGNASPCVFRPAPSLHRTWISRHATFPILFLNVRCFGRWTWWKSETRYTHETFIY